MLQTVSVCDFFISPLNVLYFLVNLLLVPNSCLLPLGEIEWKKWTIILQKSGGIIDTIVGRYGCPRYHYAAFLSNVSYFQYGFFDTFPAIAYYESPVFEVGLFLPRS